MSAPEDVLTPRANVKQFPEPEREQFPLIPFLEIELDLKQNYLVKGLIPADALVIVWGKPKCGKSFWAFDVGFHIAAGWEYRGRRVRQGRVVYCALEGAAGYGKRKAAIQCRHSIQPDTEVPLHLMAASLDLIADHVTLIAAIRRQLSGVPSCVFIDTLIRSLRGSESSDEDIAAYVRAADAIRAAFGCAVIIVHHCGYNDFRMRGHSSLIGALDMELSVKKSGEGLFTVKVERAKDEKEGETIACRLRVIDLGLDNEGDPITSCVVEAADSDGTPRAALTRKLSDRQKLAVTALKALVRSQGEALTVMFGPPAGVAAVAVTVWRDNLYRLGALDSAAKNPRADFLRLKDALRARKIIAERDGCVWLV